VTASRQMEARACLRRRRSGWALLDAGDNRLELMIPSHAGSYYASWVCVRRYRSRTTDFRPLPRTTILGERVNVTSVLRTIYGSKVLLSCSVVLPVEDIHFLGCQRYEWVMIRDLCVPVAVRRSRDSIPGLRLRLTWVCGSRLR